MNGDLGRLAADFAKMIADATNRGRGVTAAHADAAAATAKSRALSSWTKYGRGEAGSAGTIRARMSRDKSVVVGYVLADGDGAFQAENGTTTRAPDPVLAQSAESQVDAWAAGMADMGGDLL